MRKKVGKVFLRDSWVNVFVTDTGGGSFIWESNIVDNKECFIEIGLNNTRWEDTLGATLHEVIEADLSNLRLCYEHVHGYKFDSSARLFIMTHEQFDECIMASAYCLSKLIPMVRVEYIKFWKEKRSKQRKPKKKKSKVKKDG